VDPVLKFQLNQLTDGLERDEAALKGRALIHARPFIERIDLLTSVKGAITADCVKTPCYL
jgi:hypothetical protein